MRCGKGCEAKAYESRGVVGWGGLAGLGWGVVGWGGLAGLGWGVLGWGGV